MKNTATIPCHMLSAPPRLGDGLFPLWLQMGREYAIRIRKWHLPFNVSVTLLNLHVSPGTSEPAAIAAVSCLPRQTMTSILDALEKRHLAVRTPHPNDRRRKIVQLTAEGRMLAEALVRDLVKFESSAIQAVGQPLRPHLHPLLLSYTQALEKENSQETTP